MSQPTSPTPTIEAPLARTTGSTWVLVLGGLLAAVGLFRAPAQSQQGGQGGQGGQNPGQPQAPLPTVALPASNHGGSADSNDRMIAVTGVDLTGQSLLFLIDTLNPHIAVYQASGGSTSMQEIKLVAARRVDLDLLLDGFNDRSQYSYKDLQSTFAASGTLPQPAQPKNP